MKFLGLEEYVNTWENSVDGFGKIMITTKRLNKLSNLRKTVESLVKEIPEKELKRIMLVQEEAKKDKNLLKFYIDDSKLGKRKRKGEDQIYMVGEVKRIERRARKSELENARYIGATPDYFPDVPVIRDKT